MTVSGSAANSAYVNCHSTTSIRIQMQKASSNDYTICLHASRCKLTTW